MVLKYHSGEEIKKGDCVLFHRNPGVIEFVVTELGDPETDWYVREFGGGAMIVDGVAGHTFIDADGVSDDEDLEFIARAEA